MNLLAGSRLTKRLFFLHSILALQHCNFYSTKATTTIQRVQKSTKPRIQKSSEKSSSFAETIDKQTEAISTVWPKPHAIPYQAKVANFVNLMGSVKVPVQFEVDSDGKHFTATVISVGNKGVRGPLSVPVVFEGDLAHVVACHVKENDCVFVSGQLSADPLRWLLSKSLGKFHVVAENINFVVGFEKSVMDRKLGASFPAVEIDELDKVIDKNVVEKLDETDKLRDKNVDEKIDEDDRLRGKKVDEIDKLSDKNLEEKLDEIDKIRDKDVEEKLDRLDDDFNSNRFVGVEFDTAKEKSSYISVGVEGGNGSNRSWESASKKKEPHEIMDIWVELVKNPLQWWDFRGHKSNGLVKEKFPDFKQKGTGQSLWITSCPKWILPELEKLKFDVKEMKPEKASGGEGRKQNADLETLWKSLVENPDKWWDNRVGKRNSKAPDFRHKETGVALWLGRSPDWVLAKLPPVRGGLTTA